MTESAHVEIDTSGFWACVDWPYLVDPAVATNPRVRHAEGRGWVIEVDVGHATATLVGASLTEAAARQRAAELRSS